AHDEAVDGVACGHPEGDRSRDRCAVYGRVGVAVGGIRSRRQAVSPVQDADRAHRSGGTIDVFLPEVPARVTDYRRINPAPPTTRPSDTRSPESSRPPDDRAAAS